MMARDEWLAGAACAGHPDPTLWDLDHTRHTLEAPPCAKCSAALRVCAGCPVRVRCARQAIVDGDVYTVRGGWSLQPAGGGPQGRSARVPGCRWCGLPILRAHPIGRFCSHLCRQRMDNQARAA
jgi:hypothetical protein